MAWSLEIHHIDVGQGDATLIVAREVAPLIGAIPIVRSALIDGGRFNQRDSVHHYITTNTNLNRLNVMAATHYDNDHFGGLRGLLNMNVNVYDNTFIFDQGEPGHIRIKRRKRRDGPAFLDSDITNRDRDYQAYFDSIPKRVNRQRVTKKMVSSLDNFENGNIGDDGWQNPYWLVGKEIFWTDGNGNPDPTLYGVGANIPGTPGGPPAITCIAANQYVLQNGGGVAQLTTGMSVDPKNEKSLAFLVKFNNFKYYIGGDIESAQEDGINGSPGIMYYLNPTDDNAGRVHAMKTSHHGSDRSTSQAFVNRLRPSAAFISCGTGNDFGHPRQGVLQNLEQYANLQNYYLTEDRHNEDFCRRLINGVGNFPNAYTAKAVVAGTWGPPQANWGAAPPAPNPCNGIWPNDGAAASVEGHIRLTVSQGQSQGLPGGGAGAANFNVTYEHPPIAGGVTTTTNNH